MNLIAAPGDPVRGEAAIPGDKSCSHRALIFGAMAHGETTIEGLLESSDVMATARAVESFGVDVARVDANRWRITGSPWRSPATPVDCGNSGTAARLLMGAVAGMEGVIATFIGDASLSKRPMRRVMDPLRRMGAGIGEADRLPVALRGEHLGGIDHRNVPASAQVKSAILLAGLGTKSPVRVVEPVPSRDHSEIMLGHFGAEIGIAEWPDGRAVELGDRRCLKGTAIHIAADPSSAAFPLVAAAIVPGSDVAVCGMNCNPLRTGLYEVLEEMGANVELANERIMSGEIVADIRVRHADLRPCHVPPGRVPAMIDEIPALAVACAFADGESVIEGLGELKVKESDRLGGIVAGLAACGVVAIADGDRLRIFGRTAVRGGARVSSHGDHRLAMAFLTLGLGAEKAVEVDGAEMIATSFPGFADVMRSLGASIEETA